MYKKSNTFIMYQPFIRIYLTAGMKQNIIKNWYMDDKIEYKSLIPHSYIVTNMEIVDG